MPPEFIDAVVSIQENFVAGDFDIVTGDIVRLSGRPPQTLEAVLAKIFGRERTTA